MTVKICHGINVTLDAVLVNAAVPTLLVLEAVNDGHVPDHDAEEILDSIMLFGLTKSIDRQTIIQKPFKYTKTV